MFQCHYHRSPRHREQLWGPRGLQEAVADPRSTVKVTWLAVLWSACQLIRALWRDSGVIYRVSPAKPGLVLQLLRRSFSNASPAAAVAWQSREMQDRVPSQGLLLQRVPSARRRVPELPPSQGWAIHSANSLLPLHASPRDTGNGRVYYKLSEGADYCWRRSRVIKDWSGGGGGGGNRT